MSDAGRVLIIEGDARVRRTLFSALLERDVFSDTVPSGEAAAEALRQRDYALVTLDLTLGEFEAEPLFAAIAELPRNRRPMVIGTGERDMARELDADVVQIIIRKPIAIRQFAEVVKSCVAAAPQWRRQADDPQPLSELPIV